MKKLRWRYSVLGRLLPPARAATGRPPTRRPAKLLVPVLMGQQRARHRRPQAVLSSPSRPQDQEAEAPETASRRLELVGGFSTPSPTGPGLLGVPPESGPRGPWKGIAAAKEAEVDSPSGVVPGAAAAVPIAPSGGRSPPREALDREMRELIKNVRDSIKAPSSPLKNVGSDEIAALVQRQGSPLAGLEFKQTLPVIKDSDLDFDRHLREFRSIVDCYALSRKEGIRQYDLSVVFRRTLAVASTRIKIDDNMTAQAQKDNRLPFYDEILAKMKSVLRERKLTK